MRHRTCEVNSSSQLPKAHMLDHIYFCPLKIDKTDKIGLDPARDARILGELDDRSFAVHMFGCKVCHPMTDGKWGRMGGMTEIADVAQELLQFGSDYINTFSQMKA
eukprot:102445_1